MIGVEQFFNEDRGQHWRHQHGAAMTIQSEHGHETLPVEVGRFQQGKQSRDVVWQQRVEWMVVNAQAFQFRPARQLAEVPLQSAQRDRITLVGIRQVHFSNYMASLISEIAQRIQQAICLLGKLAVLFQQAKHFVQPGSISGLPAGFGQPALRQSLSPKNFNDSRAVQNDARRSRKPRAAPAIRDPPKARTPASETKSPVDRRHGSIVNLIIRAWSPLGQSMSSKEWIAKDLRGNPIGDPE